MATKPTGRAASIARNQARIAKLPAKPKKTTPTPSVAGASISSTPSVVSTTSGGGGSARGTDFAETYSGSDTGSSVVNSTVSTTPRSKSTLKNAKFSLGGGGGVTTQEKLRQESIARAEKIKKDKKTKERREKRLKNGALATDNLRASTLNTTMGESVVAKGGRSSKSAPQAPVSSRKDLILEGTGASDSPLNDRQIADLGRQGYREGDFVPGKGNLLPNGTYDVKSLQRQQLADAQAKLQKMAEQLSAKDKTSADSVISSDQPVVNEEKQAMTSIEDAAKVNLDTSYIDLEMDRLQKDLEREIKATEAQYKVDRANKETAQSAETGQTSVGLANAGGYLGFSGSATGVLLNLAKSHRAEMDQLKATKEKAIADAIDAANKGRFDLVKLKAQELKYIENETYSRKEAYLERVRKENEKQAEKDYQVKTQQDIYAAIKSGAKSVDAIFSALNGEVDVATIDKFLTSITPEGAFKFSAAQNATLLGAGMGMDDIAALSEYVMENGYDETVRGMLTPLQKVAADKIFREQPKGTGTGNGKYEYNFSNATIGNLQGIGYSSGEIEQIEHVLNNYGIEAVLFGEEDPDKRAALAKELGGSTALTSVEASLNPPSVDETITDIVSTMSGDQITKLKTLADNAGVSSMWKGKKTDIENMLKEPEMRSVLQTAIDNGLSTEEILNQLTK